jgi:hypothetical protein
VSYCNKPRFRKYHIGTMALAITIILGFIAVVEVLYQLISD